MEGIIGDEITTGTLTAVNLGDISNGTISIIDKWNTPKRIMMKKIGESVEIIYKETSDYYSGNGIISLPKERVFKIVYCVVDGKWNESERIYGNIIPAKDEDYEFEG